MLGVQPVSSSRIALEGFIVRATGVGDVNGLVGTPRASLLIAHADAADLRRTAARAPSSEAGRVTIELLERRRIGLDEVPVGVIALSTIITARAGEGRDARTSIDNDGLALRWGAHPHVNIMSSVSLIQRADLLVFNVRQIALLLLFTRHGRFDFYCIHCIDCRCQSLTRVRVWSVGGIGAEVSSQVGHFGLGLLLRHAQRPKLPPPPLQEGMVREERLDNAPGGSAQTCMHSVSVVIHRTSIIYRTSFVR
mmetsp:Transcript_27374/g.78899  ORF Transcript_27374/g.78899 Transcript_27374/m.78899 type:complete len:251 (-) Transcript_27374:67-819(-)